MRVRTWAPCLGLWLAALALGGGVDEVALALRDVREVEEPVLKRTTERKLEESRAKCQDSIQFLEALAVRLETPR